MSSRYTSRQQTDIVGGLRFQPNCYTLLPFFMLSKAQPNMNILSRSIAAEISAGIYLVLTVVFFWRQPVIATILLAAGIGLWLWLYRNRADAAAMLWAALLGTPSEMLCVHNGVWTYQAPGMIMGIPVWIPLIWASLFCLFRRITLTILDLVNRRWPDPGASARKILFGTMGAIIIFYFIWVALSIARSIALVYAIIILIAAIFWRKERDILIFLVGGFLGTVGEFICMQLGFWQYQYPYFESVGLPISLTMAWGLSAVMIGRLAMLWETKAALPSSSS